MKLTFIMLTAGRLLDPIPFDSIDACDYAAKRFSNIMQTRVFCVSREGDISGWEYGERIDDSKLEEKE